MKSCLFAEKIADLMLKVFPKAHAEEPEPETHSEPPVNVINYEELIAQARREEKDKLYPQINKLKDDLKIMTQMNNDNLLKIAEIEKSSKDKDSSKEIEKFNKKIKELEEVISSQPETISEEEFRTKLASEIRAEIESEYEVKLYKTQKLSELKDQILPTFAELVKGDTKEELETSIEWALTKTKETKEALGVSDEKKKELKKQDRPSQTNPSNSTFEEKLFDADYIRSIPADSPEWLEVRKALGLDKFNN